MAADDASTAPPGISGIVFDKDGTLTDYVASWAPLNRSAAALAARGDAVLARHLLAVGGDPGSGRAAGGSLLAAASTREIAEGWVAAGAPFDADTLEREVDAVYVAGAARAVAVTDIAGLFRRLRARGLRIGIATSDSEGGARATLAALGVDDGVFIAGYDSGHGPKPHPGMVHAFCHWAGLVPDQVAVVGDNLHDIRMGRGAGCACCVGVLTGTGTRADLAVEADHVLASVAELEAWLTGDAG